MLQVVKFDISPPLRDMKPLPWKECTKRENEESGPIPLGPVGPVVPDPVVQRLVGSIGIQIPSPIVSFDGNSNLCGCSPPDPNGAVGPNHVVTMSNLHFQIFNKSGTSLFGPAANNTLWSGFGGGCQTQNAGDPVVIYDQLADRWLLTQFTSSAPYLECVALSQTNDPTGSYYRWSIATGNGNNFPDYPKAGMWPDAYYFSTREFAGGSTFVGVGAYALDRAQALVGNPNPTIVGFLAPPSPAYVVGDGLLPSDLDGMTPPPAGSPNFFVGSEDNNGPYGAPADALTVWKFHYDPMTPGNSTFMLTNTIPVAPFNSILGLCGGTRACIPQPGTANRIDHLGYRQRPLHRLAYRNFGTHESLVTNQSVSAGTGPNGEVSGIRWWELRSPNAAPVIFQEGTYAPGLTDGIHRWMGSIAMDGAGNMALGYSASNGTVFPSVFYTGRLAGDPLGTMPLGEGSIINGTGSQTGSNRWGDYTAISVDPTDDFTFWYVNEYVPTTSSIGWRLRIGSFKVSLGFSVTTTVPAVGSVVFTQPTDFVVNVTDPVNPATLQASDFTVNGTPANTVAYTPGTTTMTFHFNSTPVITQGLQTMHIAAGAFNKASGGDPVLEFTGTFRYDAVLLQVTTTVPPVGGVFSPPAPGIYQYDVNWNEAVDPTSVQTTDLTLSGTAGATVTAVTVINANTTTRFTLNIPFGGTLTANIAAGAITDAFGNPNAAFSGNYTVQGCPPQDHYNIAQIGGSIVPGTTDIGNHGDDVVTNVVLPFRLRPLWHEFHERQSVVQRQRPVRDHG